MDRLDVWSVPVEGQVLGALSPEDDYVMVWGQRVQFYDRADAQPIGPDVPGVAAKGYSEEGHPYYDIQDLAEAMGVPTVIVSAQQARNESTPVG